MTNTDTLTAIVLTAELLGALSEDDQMQVVQCEGEEVSVEKLKKVLSETGYSTCLGHTIQENTDSSMAGVFLKAHLSAEGAKMINKEVNMTTTEAKVKSAYNTRKYKKAQLAEMLTMADARIVELEARIQAGVVARAQKGANHGVLRGDAKRNAMEYVGMFQLFTENQKDWLKKNSGRNWVNIIVERTNNGLKFKFNFPKQTRELLVGMLAAGCKNKGFEPKFQAKHVYVHCY